MPGSPAPPAARALATRLRQDGWWLALAGRVTGQVWSLDAGFSSIRPMVR
jgi:hypothetical protein